MVDLEIEDCIRLLETQIAAGLVDGIVIVTIGPKERPASWMASNLHTSKKLQLIGALESARLRITANLLQEAEGEANLGPQVVQ